jgi:outer membrane protein TolC
MKLRILLALIFSNALLCAEPLPFRRAMELALSHSSTLAMAAADQTRANESYREARSGYLPQVVVGSGVGGTYGFPLSIEGSAPSIFNVNSQQFLFNPAQRDFIRAARSAWLATSSHTKDQRSLALLDAAITYIQLDAVSGKLHALQQEQSAAQRIENIVGERVKEGVSSQADLTRARLAGARVRMRIAEAQGAADVLRQHLAQLTGFPEQTLETVTESIPRLPEMAPAADLPSRAVESSMLVKSAEQQAEEKQFRARGEHRALFPAIDLAGQYALLSRANNYEDFFRKFQRNNATVGLAIRFPFLSPVQRAHAAAAEAEAVRARKEADGVRNQVSSDTLKLQRGVQQLSAAKEVAQLEFQLAQGDLETVQTRLQAGATVPAEQPPPNEPGAQRPVSILDQHNAEIKMHDQYAVLLDASFELDKAHLQLLRMTGELEDWALSAR